MEFGDGFDGRVILGPMSGYTTPCYRRFMEPFGAAASITEMVSAAGLYYDPKGSHRFVEASGIAPTGAQVFGSDPASVARGASIALDMEPRLRFIDINMGCPMHKVTRSGAGSVLLDDPELCGRIVKETKDAVDVPVTAKIRLGRDRSSVTWRRVVDALLGAEADAICIHARTADQRYAGDADYSEIEGLQNRLPVPLIVSGDIFTADDAVRAVGTTGARYVMVARGGVGNPYLLTQIDRRLRTGEVLPNPTIAQQADWCLRLMDMVIEESGPVIALGRMRGIAPKFLAGCRYSRDYRRAFTDRTTDLDRMRGMLERIRDEMGDAVFRSAEACRSGVDDLRARLYYHP